MKPKPNVVHFEEQMGALVGFAEQNCLIEEIASSMFNPNDESVMNCS